MIIKKFLKLFNNSIYKIKFCKFNEKLFTKKSKKINSNDIILVEVNNIFSSIISYSLVVNTLSSLHNSRIVGYNIYKKNVIKKIIQNLSPFSIKKIYKSFGVDEVIDINYKNELEYEAYFKNKSQLLEFSLDGIKLGDLVYDSYLRTKYKSTIDLQSHEFKEFFLEFVKKYYFWDDYFKKYNVRSIIASHSVYDIGVPIRIAISKNIPAYVVGISFLNFFDKKRIFEVDSKAYGEYFENLNEDQRQKAIEISKKQLDAKFKINNGYASSTELYQSSTPSVIQDQKYETFGQIKNKNIFLKNNKPNILITAHCFYDSPHAVANLLFSDFYEWIKHLGELSNETDYNWYIKKHPHTNNKNLNNKVLDSLVKKYPKLIILDEKINNSELINNGIDLALTVYGSVGYEFPYFNIPVLIASNKTSYEDYNFCIQPKNLKEYDYFIKNISKIKLDINRDEIYKFYFNRYLASWSLLDDYVKNKISLKNEFFGPKILDVWMKQFKLEKIEKINFEILEFIKQKKYRLISKNAYDEINFQRD